MTSLDDKEILANIERIYRDKLLREPDKKGLLHWFEEIKTGRIHISCLVEIFESSQEFKMLKELKDGYTVTEEGFGIFLDPEDEVVSRAIVFDKIWEPYETRFLKKIIKEGMTVLDIGANIGYFTILLSKLVGEKGKVLSFEPNYTSYTILQKNIIANHLQNVTAISKAVSDFNDKSTLFLSKTNHGDNRLFGAIIEETDRDRQTVNVDVISLDAFLKDENIDFLRADIQGSEMRMIEGANGIIERSQNLKMILEFWPIGLRSQMDKPEDFILKLNNMRFTIYDMSKEEAMKKTTVEELLSKYTNKSFTNLYCTRET